MGTGTWVSCLLLAAGATPGIPAGVAPYNDNKLEIPINVDAERRHEIRALELHVSTDQGKTWQQVGAATPDKSSFRFTAQADGVYWLTVRVIDQQGRKEPQDLTTAPVGQKILIDTLKPDVRLTHERKGETVSLRWEVREEYANLDSFRLEYQPAGGGEWAPVPATSSHKGLVGQASFRSPSAVTVRLKVDDAAGNVGAAEARVAAAPGALTTSAAPPPAAAEIAPPALPPPSAPDLGPPLPVPPAVSPAPGGPAVAAQPAPREPAPDVIRTASVVPPPAKPPTAPGREELLAPTPPGVVANSTGPSPTPAPPSAPSATRPEWDGAANQVVSNRRVTMEYEVSKFGPSGVGSVELYVTRDNGLTWKRVEGEHGAGAVPAASSDVIRRTISVDLVEDGGYGFFLVVKSGAGLGERPPRSGDAPQMRVELDTTVPEAELYGPQANPSQRETLLLTWKASDNKLAGSPVTLQWAERRDGPWEYIGAPQLPNSGSFAWRVPRSVPPKVYLRLTVRDAAGNAAVAETRDPVLVDLTVPVSRILGLVRAAREGCPPSPGRVFLPENNSSFGFCWIVN